jgi:hypothetical protein
MQAEKDPTMKGNNQCIYKGLGSKLKKKERIKMRRFAKIKWSTPRFRVITTPNSTADKMLRLSIVEHWEWVRSENSLLEYDF